MSDWQWQEKAGVHWMTCLSFEQRVKPFKHAFTGRRDPGDFGASGSNSREASKLLLGALELPSQDVVFPHQVHGARVLLNPSVDHHKPSDAIVSTEPCRSIAVRIADCVPILLVDPSAKVCAAVHAGWRGIVQRILIDSVVRMRGQGASAKNIFAAIGPSIGGCCYQVSPRVQQQIEDSVGGDSLNSAGRPQHVDLRLAAQRQLLRNGVPEDQIWVSSACTYCEPQHWFSYRREEALAGRQIALLASA